MCREIGFPIILASVPIWTFVVLPIIYLNGGPDQLSTLLRSSSMEIGNVASVISALAAIAAAGFAWLAILRQTRTQKWLANHDLLKRANDMIIDDPRLLEILGIDLNKVTADGLTAEELVFINTHLDASSIYWRISVGKSKLTQYRKNFLRHPKVQLAWRNHLRDRTQNPGPWMDAVDAYLRQPD
jgi:hypothetical protein